MDFELLNAFSGFRIGAKLNGRGDATTKLEMIFLQVRKLNFLNEMQLGDFPGAGLAQLLVCSLQGRFEVICGKFKYLMCCLI